MAAATRDRSTKGKQSAGNSQSRFRRPATSAPSSPSSVAKQGVRERQAAARARAGANRRRPLNPTSASLIRTSGQTRPQLLHREDVGRPDASPGISLPMLFVASGFLVGAVLVVACALDMVAGVPFFGASTLFDVGFLFAGANLLYLSWNARDGCR